MLALLLSLAMFAVFFTLLWKGVAKIARSPHRNLLVSLCIAVAAALPIGWHVITQRFTMSMVPDALGVSSVSYSAEESWGFGPGGNETGVHLYPLSAQVSQQITEQGSAYFEAMPPNDDQASRGWRGQDAHWQPTPIATTVTRPTEEKAVPFSLEAYHDAYGFSIAIDDAVSTQVNRILQTPGAYYAYGRIGIIVVSPGERLVVYMYNG
ncbi:MAG: hypothetical protein WKG03_12885 [Telluria sp.]